MVFSSLPAQEPAQLVSTEPLFLKLAVTLRDTIIVNLHGPEPLHGPLQPEKMVPGSGIAVSVTVELFLYDVLHFLPQSIPLSMEVTVPFPVLPTINSNELPSPDAHATEGPTLEQPTSIKAARR